MNEITLSSDVTVAIETKSGSEFIAIVYATIMVVEIATRENGELVSFAGGKWDGGNIVGCVPILSEELAELLDQAIDDAIFEQEK